MNSVSQHTDLEALGYSREKPHGIDGDLGDAQISLLVDTDFTIDLHPAGPDTLGEVGKTHLCLCDGNGRTDIDSLLDVLLVLPRANVAERVHRDDLLRVAPLRLLLKLEHRLGVGEVRFVIVRQTAAGDGEGLVYGVGAAMGTDGWGSQQASLENEVQLQLQRHTVSALDGVVVARNDNRASLLGISFTPMQGNRVDPDLVRVGREDDFLVTQASKGGRFGR